VADLSPLGANIGIFNEGEFEATVTRVPEPQAFSLLLIGRAALFGFLKLGESRMHTRS
jgi:hypothetical protein